MRADSSPLRLFDCFLLVTVLLSTLPASSLVGCVDFATGARRFAVTFSCFEAAILLATLAAGRGVGFAAGGADFSSGDGSRKTDGDGIVIASAIRVWRCDGQGTSPILTRRQSMKIAVRLGRGESDIAASHPTVSNHAAGYRDNECPAS